MGDRRDSGGTGLGVGVIFAVLPGLIVGAVPPHETGSATSFNLVIRYIGYAAGSTLSAVVLQANTAPAHSLPAASGYTVAGLVGCGTWLVTAVVCLLLPRVRERTENRPDPDDAADATLQRPHSLGSNADQDLSSPPAGAETRPLSPGPPGAAPPSPTVD